MSQPQERAPSDYQLLDSGGGNRFERVGPHLLVRPAPQAVWTPRQPLDAWQKADAVFERKPSGGGVWSHRCALPESWVISCRGLSFRIKPTAFGHLGFFPEHTAVWSWIEERVRSGMRPCRMLNLFAYTGAATLAAARAGAEVCHLDSSRSVVAWARDNAALSRLEDCSIRWIVEDAAKFLKREARRGSRYDALLLDPPSFGRGSKGEVFKIEEDLPALLGQARAVLAERPRFVILTCHSPGFTPRVLANLMDDMVAGLPGRTEADEMLILEEGGRALPSGALARWIGPA